MPEVWETHKWNDAAQERVNHCTCGTFFKSHAFMIMGGRMIFIISRKPCPSCGNYDKVRFSYFEGEGGETEAPAKRELVMEAAHALRVYNRRRMYGAQVFAESQGSGKASEKPVGNQDARQLQE